MITLGILFSCIYSIMTYSFNFNYPLKDVPCFLGEEEQYLYKARPQKLYANFFWHLSFFNNEDIASFRSKKKSGKQIVIAILDTDFADRSNRGKISAPQYFRLEERIVTPIIFDQGAILSQPFVVDQKNENLLTQAAIKKDFWIQLIQKNHGDVSTRLITQIVPHAIILRIPVLDVHGQADKHVLYQGLLQAQKNNVDIVHMGLQIFDVDQTCELDQKIINLIKSFSYVIAATGNYGDIINGIGAPAVFEGVISVGSFGLRSNRYIHSDFCQATANSPADFIMPGENIWTSLWVDEIKDYITVPVSGTSFSAALMTGVLAIILEKNNNRLCSQHIIKLLQRCSYKRDASWKNCIKYGVPVIEEVLYHLDLLTHFNKKKIEHYFCDVHNFCDLHNSMSR